MLPPPQLKKMSGAFWVLMIVWSFCWYSAPGILSRMTLTSDVSLKVETICSSTLLVASP
jgi:hypothetical protein